MSFIEQYLTSEPDEKAGVMPYREIALKSFLDGVRQGVSSSGSIEIDEKEWQRMISVLDPETTLAGKVLDRFGVITGEARLYSELLKIGMNVSGSENGDRRIQAFAQNSSNQTFMTSQMRNISSAFAISSNQIFKGKP